MHSCQRLSCHVVLLAVITFGCAVATPTAEAEPAPRRIGGDAMLVDEPHFVVITEDHIPDVENTTQKVIRVNPLELPAGKDDPTGSTDSSLYKIKSLLPAHRNYVNSNRMRKPRPPRPQSAVEEDSPIFRHQQPPTEPKPHKPKTHPKQKPKHLHFLYNQAPIDGSKEVGKTMRVHVAPGAYPIYYAVSKSNGRFGKFPIKGFRTQAEFMKYLLKSKAVTIDRTQRFES